MTDYLNSKVAAARGRAEAAEHRAERSEHRRRVAQAYNNWLRQVITDAEHEVDRAFTPGESIDTRLDRIARILSRQPPVFRIEHDTTERTAP